MWAGTIAPRAGAVKRAPPDARLRPRSGPQSVNGLEATAGAGSRYDTLRWHVLHSSMTRPTVGSGPCSGVRLMVMSAQYGQTSGCRSRSASISANVSGARNSFTCLRPTISPLGAVSGDAPSLAPALCGIGTPIGDVSEDGDGFLGRSSFSCRLLFAVVTTNTSEKHSVVLSGSLDEAPLSKYVRKLTPEHLCRLNSVVRS